jgi:hypothetical protein
MNDAPQEKKAESLFDEEVIESSERIDNPFDPSKINVVRESMSIFQAIRKIQLHEIKLDPDFQRNLVWDDTRQSRLIESILLKIPLPAFYLDAIEPDRWVVAPLLYGRTRSQQISNAMLLLENSDKRSFADVESQFSLWMGRLFPGFQVRTENLEQLDSVMLGLNLQREVGAAEYFRPGNVGFGVSVALPVILAGLLADKETTFIVENPEAHLHPSAQSLVGEFLARVAAGGAQVFVETHSDHVVNGMRIAFRNGVLSKDDLSFFAFSKTDAYGSHRITTVQLDESGDFDVRPDTFFDQADKDLKLIYGIG